MTLVTNSLNMFKKSIILILSVFVLLSCNRQEEQRELIIYVSVDQNYSEQLLQRFEEQTGIKVKAVFDVEASKTTGLVNRLLEEKSNPRADVFWNGEIMQTIKLKKADVLTPYKSANAESIPAGFKDKDHYWTGFGGRARILICNNELYKDADKPVSFFDLPLENIEGSKQGLALPLFGTTFTHIAALYQVLGDSLAYSKLVEFHDAGMTIAQGNGSVRDMVVDGRLVIGYTDTDDACSAIKKGAAVSVVFPDQDSLGTLIIPNTVAMVNGARNIKEAEAFIDFILSEETEKFLMEIGWIQVSTRGLKYDDCYDQEVKAMPVDFEKVYEKMELVRKDMTDLFIN